MVNLFPSICLTGRGKPRQLQCPVIQSPLAGVTDKIFRSLVREWAPEALLFTEMVNANSLKCGYGISKIESLDKEIGPIGVQLFDHRPESMANAARQAEEAGAFLIDINMGCPVKKIARKGGGSALLKEPDLAIKIVKTVVASVKIPVTVKTRLGWDKESSDPVEFALKMQDAGAQLLTMHGRTREQGFSGNANWEAISQVKKKLHIPLIANGDINSVDDAFHCLKVTGADGLMVGRGSLGAPWLVGQINAALMGKPLIETPRPKDRLSLILHQLKNLLESKGDHGLLIARKHMNWTCRGFSGASKLRNALIKAGTPSEAINLLEERIKSMH